MTLSKYIIISYPRSLSKELRRNVEEPGDKLMYSSFKKLDIYIYIAMALSLLFVVVPCNYIVPTLLNMCMSTSSFVS